MVWLFMAWISCNCCCKNSVIVGRMVLVWWLLNLMCNWVKSILVVNVVWFLIILMIFFSRYIVILKIWCWSSLMICSGLRIISFMWESFFLGICVMVFIVIMEWKFVIFFCVKIIGLFVIFLLLVILIWLMLMSFFRNLWNWGSILRKS